MKKYYIKSVKGKRILKYNHDTYTGIKYTC